MLIFAFLAIILLLWLARKWSDRQCRRATEAARQASFAGFWRRFAAIWIDLAVVMPAFVLTEVICSGQCPACGSPGLKRQVPARGRSSR